MPKGREGFKNKGLAMATFDYSVRFRADDKITRTLAKLQTKLEDIQRTTQKITKSSSKMSLKMSKGIDSVNNKLRHQSEAIATTATSFAALGASMIMPIKAAMDFEESMAEVKKVVDGTPKTFAQLKNDVFEMSKTIPLLPKQLNDIVAAGGRLGIPADKLTGFTQVVAKAAVAFDMSAEMAGDAFASLSNKMNIPLDRIGNLGDAINHLADSTAAKAPQIINIMGRLAGTLKQLEIPPELGAGIAAFASQSFVSQELAASGVNQFVGALARTDKKFGLFTKLQREGAAGFRDILKSMKKLDITQLTEMFGVESARAIATMSGNLEVYDKTLSKVADKTKFAGSMQREFEARSATTANQLTLMNNGLNRLAITIGDAFLPIVNKILKEISPVVESISVWVKNNPQLTQTILKVVGAMAALVGGMLALKLIAPAIIGGLTVLKFAATGLGIAFKVLNFVMKMNPIGLVITAIIALIGYFGGFDAIINKVKDTLSGWFDWLRTKVPFLDTIINAVKGIAGAIGFGNSEIAVKEQATVENIVKPVSNINRTESTINVNLEAQGLNVKSVQQKTVGAGLNVGVNTLGS